ncbi:MAG: LysE family translocator [Actinomycetota bacterium]|nr:LysE family translocator [Actinomycetota bacterium]
MIPDAATVAVFAAAALALLVVPGPAVLYIVAQSVHRGRGAGLVSMLGIQVGGLVHVAAAALGLSSLLVSSAFAFEIVKYAGAAYLVLLGIRRLLDRDREEIVEVGSERELGRLFRRGILVNVLNPKTALFFFAFLPQFVDPATPTPALQIAFLGLLFVGIAVVSDGAYALAAGTLGGWLRRSRWFVRAERFVSGSVFVGLGVATAFAGSKRAT